MWLTNLKIAIVEKDSDKLNNLINDIPEFENTQEMQEALCLTKEALTLLHTLKDETVDSMKQIKKNLDFLKSTQAPLATKLDIKS